MKAGIAGTSPEPHVAAGCPAGVFQENHRALQLGQSAEDRSGVHAEADRLVEGSGRKIQVEKAIGIAPVALEVPVTCIEKVEPAKLKPGPSVIGGGSQVTTQQPDRHPALARSLQCGRAGGHVRIYRRLGKRLSDQEDGGSCESSRTSAGEA